MDDNRQDLYKIRAQYADLESDIEQAKKEAFVDSWFWRFCIWLERLSRKRRAKVQADIDDLNRRED